MLVFVNNSNTACLMYVKKNHNIHFHSLWILFLSVSDTYCIVFFYLSCKRIVRLISYKRNSYFNSLCCELALRFLFGNISSLHPSSLLLFSSLGVPAMRIMFTCLMLPCWKHAQFLFVTCLNYHVCSHIASADEQD